MSSLILIGCIMLASSIILFLIGVYVVAKIVKEDEVHIIEHRRLYNEVARNK